MASMIGIKRFNIGIRASGNIGRAGKALTRPCWSPPCGPVTWAAKSTVCSVVSESNL